MAHAIKWLLWLGLSLLCACTPRAQQKDTQQVTLIDRSDLPLEHASAAQLARFAVGDDLFEATFREADGLGPLYVRASCSACHRSDGRGPGRVAKMVVRDDEARAALLPFGVTERPYVTRGAKQALLATKDDPRITITFRFPPAVFGRGYLEAVDDAEIERLAREAAKRTGSIRGRINRVAAPYADEDAPKHIGRFGLKARLATLDEFTADAFHGDMGITSPIYEDEAANPEAITDDDKPGVDVSRELITQVADYVRMLEIPARKASSVDGAVAFAEAQCSTCHVPALLTRRDYPIAALAGISAPVFTDFLLHDMGDALADGLREGDAGPREFRTAPLLGLRFSSAFLHDGRAKTIEQAVLAHSSTHSEANDSIAKFSKLSMAARTALLEYVASL